MTRFLTVLKIISALISLCFFYGFVVEPKFLKIRHTSFLLSQYSGSPLRVVLLSDLHIAGLHVPAERVETIIARVNELQPDIVLIAGDFISGHVPRANNTVEFNTEIDEGLSHLSGLQPSLGTYAAIGNHDVFYGVDYIKQTLDENGITVLQNKAFNLPNGLCIVGLADHEQQTEDPKAFDDCNEGAAIIALMHSPDSFKFLRSDTALAVAGHTHGGQINIPLLGRRITSTSAGRKYAYGRVDAEGIPAFVTAGIGTSILPARFRSPPEIVLMELGPTSVPDDQP